MATDERLLCSLALEASTRPLQRAIDGGDRVVEHLRDLARRPAEHVAEQQHRPLLRRQQLHRRDEGQFDPFACLDRGFRPGVGRGQFLEQPVR